MIRISVRRYCWSWERATSFRSICLRLRISSPRSQPGGLGGDGVPEKSLAIANWLGRAPSSPRPGSLRSGSYPFASEVRGGGARGCRAGRQRVVCTQTMPDRRAPPTLLSPLCLTLSRPAFWALGVGRHHWRGRDREALEIGLSRSPIPDPVIRTRPIPHATLPLWSARWPPKPSRKERGQDRRTQRGVDEKKDREVRVPNKINELVELMFRSECRSVHAGQAFTASPRHPTPAHAVRSRPPRTSRSA